jgi:predicted aspartyl protease
MLAIACRLAEAENMTRLAALLTLLVATGCAPGLPAEAVRSPSVPARIVNNLPLLEARVRQSYPLIFILDTGAEATVIDKGSADALNLKFGSAGSATTGGGSLAASEIEPIELMIGKIRLPAIPLVALDLRSLTSGLGVKIDGILGADVFERFVVDIDYAHGRVAFHEPAGFAYKDQGLLLPLRIEGGIPLATVGVTTDDGRVIEAQVEFDTGQTGGMTLLEPFANRYRLFSADHPSLSITTGALIAGGVGARVTRVREIRLGELSLSEPLANVVPDAEAAGTAEGTDGILGGEVLRRFRTIVDYSRRRAILEPGPQVRAPFEFDASGLSLMAASTDPVEYRIRAVIPGSPGDMAGLKQGDVIVRVDERDAPSMTLVEIRAILRTSDRTVSLLVKRSGEMQHVSLVTRRLI